MINDVRSQAGVESTGSYSSPLISARLLPYSYHEVTTDHHVQPVDVLEQLKANITQLEDLHTRLRFMMGEVRTLMKRG